MTVPLKITVLAASAVVASGGMLLTLAYDQGLNRNTQGESQVDQNSGNQDVQDVVENPSVDVVIDGQKVPATPGKSKFETSNGTAEVNVSSDRVGVNQNSNSSTPGNVDVRINTSTSGNTDSNTRYRYSSKSSSDSNTSSSVEVKTDGDGTVKVNQD